MRKGSKRKKKDKKRKNQQKETEEMQKENGGREERRPGGGGAAGMTLEVTPSKQGGSLMHHPLNGQRAAAGEDLRPADHPPRRPLPPRNTETLGITRGSLYQPASGKPGG